jgi:hypothetical protein
MTFRGPGKVLLLLSVWPSPLSPGLHHGVGLVPRRALLGTWRRGTAKQTFFRNRKESVPAYSSPRAKEQ